METSFLKPSHLIHGRRLDTISINQSEVEHTYLVDRFVYLSKSLIDFRNRWNKQYLLQLSEHIKYRNEGLDTCNKGEIAFVYEPNKKRADFETVMIENFKQFQGGKKRIVVVKCIIEGSIATLTRPINKPFLLRLVHT